MGYASAPRSGAPECRSKQRFPQHLNPPGHPRHTLDMSPIPDFNDSELWTVQSTLKERYGQDVDMQQGDTDVRQSRIPMIVEERAVLAGYTRA